jgi:ligand-binding SRPBCC domain-containing protein
MILRQESTARTAASLLTVAMHLNAETWVSLPREAVFPFFADAANLQQLTPPWLRFQIRTPQPIEMRLGARIEYRISLHGLPMSWLTEISAYQPPQMFVDRQLRGPYRTWIHTHQFRADRGGTLLLDHVEFDMLGGALVAPLVRRDLLKIFTFRHHALLAHFSQPTPWPEAKITFD